MPRPLIAGNWKMHKTIAETIEFVQGLKRRFPKDDGRDILIAPSFTSLHAAAKEAKGTHINIAAQNIYWQEQGAFTGEISAQMVIEAGCHFAIIGHSERRRIFREGDREINLKLQAALKAGLKPIFCIGEDLNEREAGIAFQVIEGQLKQGLQELSVDDIGQVTVAYEPVWAIGTGRNATPDQAEEMHSFIRAKLAAMVKMGERTELRILYGGSVSPANIKGLMSQPDIDGVLVGGASLDLDSFTELIRF